MSGEVTSRFANLIRNGYIRRLPEESSESRECIHRFHYIIPLDRCPLLRIVPDKAGTHTLPFYMEGMYSTRHMLSTGLDKPSLRMLRMY